MPPRNYKPIPASLRSAFESDREFARRHHRTSIEHIAELMELTPGNLYKQIEDGTLHTSRLLAWSKHTGSDAVVRYLAARLGKVVIDIPAGRRADAEDVHALQATLNDAVGALLDYMRGAADQATTLGKLGAGLEALAWHRANVAKADQPELDF